MYSQTPTPPKQLSNRGSTVHGAPISQDGGGGGGGPDLQTQCL